MHSYIIYSSGILVFDRSVDGLLEPEDSNKLMPSSSAKVGKYWCCPLFGRWLLILNRKVVYWCLHVGSVTIASFCQLPLQYVSAFRTKNGMEIGCLYKILWM